ncbi:hypothetical protein RB653_003151 [Dictyostelium firmibasis]|uniref:Thioredoxin domain-containing protein n=1 Tax=Dictyostelium firmibasis TaxID=79012 RepID=A0AAN7TZ49_9MYCE
MVYFEATSSEKFDQLFNKYKSHKVIIFVSSITSPECKKILPSFKASASSHKEIIHIQVDIMHCFESKIISDNINHVPLFLFYKKGKQIDSLVGVNTNSYNKKVIAFSK